MAGFEPQETQFRLTFEEPDLQGLEVLMGSLSVGEYTEMQRMSLPKAMGDVENLDRDKLLELVVQRAEETFQANERLLGLFASRLISWNITKGGVPVEATLAGIQSQDSRLISRLVGAWQRALIQGPPPLKEPSPAGGNGHPSQETMDALTASSRVTPADPASPGS